MTNTNKFLTLFLLMITTVLAASKNASGDHNQTIIDGPLFEKYQFLSPGIMMGFVTIVILGSILGVGVSALSSLEVTYPAFEKENGPGGKKQQ